MQRVHVFIATTAGPVRVQYVCGSPYPDEGPPIDHHTGVNGEGAADFNEEYNRFANLVVSRYFGRRWFNASIETDIQQGESWKLALLSAHAVETDGACKLADAEVREEDWVVLATGNVTQDSQIRVVGCIDQKFEGARKHLDSWLDAGSRVVAVVPQDNDGNVPEELRNYRRNGNRLTVVASASVADLLSQLSHLGFLTGPVAATDTGRKADVSAEAHAAPKAGSSRRLWWMGAAVLTLAVILASEENTPDVVRDVVKQGRNIGEKMMGEVARFVEESEVTMIRLSEAPREVDDRNGDSRLTAEASAMHDDSALSVIDPSASRSVGGSSANLRSDIISTVGVLDRDYETKFGEAVDMTEPDVSCSHQSSKSARSMPFPSQHITIYLIEKIDPSFLILRFKIEGEIQGSDRANLQKIVETTVKDVLNNSGYRTEIESFSGNNSTIRWNGEQFVHPASSVMMGTSLLFRFQISRQKYQYRSTFGDWLRVGLSVEAVVPDGTDSRTPLRFEHTEWKPISPMCGQECVELTKAVTDMVRSAVKRLAGQIVSMLTEQHPDAATSYRYKLVLNNLSREKRTGIEHALVQLPEYLSHRSEYSGTIRSEWEYVSHINAPHLCHRLLEIVRFEELEESVSIMIR